jgi:hypothetical protein
MTTELSPAAQAVLDAADEVFSNAGTTRQGLAAALRAAVARTQMDLYEDCSIKARGSFCEADDLLAIAAELDGANSTS